MRLRLTRVLKIVSGIPWYCHAAAAIFVSSCLLLYGCFEPFWQYAPPLLTEPVGDVYFYFIFAGAMQLTGLAAGVLALTPRAFTRGFRAYAATMGRFLEFNVVLLLAGAAGNLLWVEVARDKMYVAGDPVVEFFAFLPYSSAIYDYDWGQSHGHLVGGASDAQLALLWASIALLVWSTTALVLRHLHARNASGSAIF